MLHRAVRRGRNFRRKYDGTSRTRIFRFEALEPRLVLSASGLSDTLATPAAYVLPQVTNTVPSGYTPSQIRHAYGFDQISFSNGTITGNGSGQTIAIVYAYGDPNIASDLHVFDTTFGLTDPKFT